MFENIGGSIRGVLIGIVMFLVAFPMLFINEGRAVTTYRALLEGAGSVQSVSADTVDPAHEGQLIHISGLATTTETLTDGNFGVSVNALRLEREVEMYQWRENSETEGTGENRRTVYTYERVWSDRLIDSSGFEQPQNPANPTSMAYNNQELVAQNVTVGAYTLPESMVSRVGRAEALPVTEPAPITGTQIVQGQYYLGNNPQSPQIGDMRVSFSVVNPTDVSIVAQQSGSSFVPYQVTSNRTIDMVQNGIVPAEDMFESAQASNTMLTWALRIAGFAVMFFGVTMVFRPISDMLGIIPILGNLSGMAFGVLAFLISAPISLLVISVAWVFYRPLFGLSLLAIGALLIGGAVYLIMQWRNGDEEPAAA